MAAPDRPVHLAEALARFDETWSPKIVAEANDWHVLLVKADGEFVWHDHPETDELFLVLSGRLVIRLEDRPEVELGAGEVFVVPKGLRHQPVATACEMLLLEPADTANTGGVESDLAHDAEWIV
jgi:mannose-6-phosphate isomerase-like protein (cupin superfamily)